MDDRTPFEDLEEQLSNWKPYSSSYYVPESLARIGLTFLINRRCTTNLLAKFIWEELPAAKWMATLDTAGLAHQADRSQLLVLQGVVKLPSQIQGVPIRGAFTIDKTKESPMLGMPMLGFPSWQ